MKPSVLMTPIQITRIPKNSESEKAMCDYLYFLQNQSIWLSWCFDRVRPLQGFHINISNYTNFHSDSYKNAEKHIPLAKPQKPYRQLEIVA